MACPLPADQLRNLRVFIDVCKKNSNFLHHPDLKFFREYIESLGGVIPQKKPDVRTEKTESEAKEEKTEAEAETVEEGPESEESEVELDYEGVIEPDNDPPQTMGYTDAEVTEDDINKSEERKRCAIELYMEQKYEEAINAYSEAILLNPNSALLHAKRGQCYLMLKKPNACVRDCTRALEINPDNAAAYKFRGRAHRLLGNFLKAAEDLRNACKIDYDEQADEWLKEVTPNARKLEEHQRKYERKKLEKEVKVIKDRIKKMREEQQKRAAEMQNRNDSDDEGIEGGPGANKGMGDVMDMLKDPEIIKMFQDPEVCAALQDMSTNPANIIKYQNIPKINKVLQKLSTKLSGKMPAGFPAGFPGAFPGGFPGGFPSFSGSNQPGAGGNSDTGADKPAPPPSADIDLD